MAKVTNDIVVIEWKQQTTTFDISSLLVMHYSIFKNAAGGVLAIELHKGDRLNFSAQSAVEEAELKAIHDVIQQSWMDYNKPWTKPSVITEGAQAEGAGE